MQMVALNEIKNNWKYNKHPMFYIKHLTIILEEGWRRATGLSKGTA